jgi:hypothetical protein
MMPEVPIEVPPEAYDAAAALRDDLEASAGTKCTVGVGLKQTAGDFSGQVALFVYVPEKKPERDLSAAELVPSEFRGFVTDVVESRPTLIDDDSTYDPLRGGIMMAREHAPLEDGIMAPAPGTLGAIVRSRATGVLQFLTCAHVVKSTGRNVYQPRQQSIGSTTDFAGTVTALRDEATPLFLDCAVGTLNGFRSGEASVQDIGQVRGASLQPPGLGEMVKKRGARTLLTQGFVVRITPSVFVPSVNIIEISGGVPFVTLFAGKGDSGAVLLNSNDQVIGLLFAIPAEDLGPGLGSGALAMPIHNVQEALQVDIAT